VLGFTAAIACVTGVLFGLVPSWQLSRTDLVAQLKHDGRGNVGTGMRRGIGDLLIVAEVSLAFVLLVGALLLAGSLSRLEGVDPGFHPTEVLTLQLSLPTATYEEGEQIPFYAQLEQRILGLPGVRNVGAVNILPLSANYDSRPIQIEDRPVAPWDRPGVQVRSVTPGYFRALGAAIVSGREFDSRDRAGSPLVVIVSESMTSRFWPGENAIGKRVTFNHGVPEELQREIGGAGSREIVGIVRDVKHLALEEEAVPMMYTPHSQQPSYHTMTLLVRASRDPGALTSSIRRELAAMDARVPVYAVRTLETVLDTAVAAPRYRTVLLGAFASVALLLALVGVYGVVRYAVSQRTHEIGVRMALGARRSDVLRLIVRQGMLPVVAGALLGLAGAAALSRLLRGMLFGVSPTDLTTFVAAGVLLTGAALAATLLPAVRAARVDPIRALSGVGT
jgi:putative ABC transport system permease protein